MELESQNQRPRLHSRLVPQGPMAHKSSAFAHLELGQHPMSAAEPVFTSSWLWQSTWLFSDAPIRVAVTFPDEWHALKESRIDESVWKRLAIDFWVFKDLSSGDHCLLEKLTTAESKHRVVIAASFLSPWTKLVENMHFRNLAGENRGFVHFIPKKNEHDPFLTPQEVLWELKKIPKDVAIFTCDYSEPIVEEQKFFQTIDPADYIAYKNPPALIRGLRFLDRVGLGEMVYDIEAFLGFSVDRNKNRLAPLGMPTRFLFGFSFFKKTFLKIRKEIKFFFEKIFWKVLPVWNFTLLYVFKKPIWFVYPKVCAAWGSFKNISLIKWKVLPVWNRAVFLIFKRPIYGIAKLWWRLFPKLNELSLWFKKLYVQAKNNAIKTYWAAYPIINSIVAVLKPSYFLPKMGWGLYPIWNSFFLYAFKKPYWKLVAGFNFLRKIWLLRWKLYPIWNSFVSSVRWRLYSIWNAFVLYLFVKPYWKLVAGFNFLRKIWLLRWRLYPIWNSFVSSVRWRLYSIWNSFVLYGIKKPYYLRWKVYEAIKFLAYPLRKIYWMVEFQIQKRLRRNA